MRLLCVAVATALIFAKPAFSQEGAEWKKTVVAARQLIKRGTPGRARYAARAVVIFDSQILALQLVERDIAAFKERNKERGFFVGVATPASMLARIGAARRQTARLRALAPVPKGFERAATHFAAYCTAVDEYLDAVKLFAATNDALGFDVVSSRSLDVATREGRSGAVAVARALKSGR